MAFAAVVQMVSSAVIHSNLMSLKTYLASAHEASARLVVLPENFAFMGKSDGDKLAIAEAFHSGPIQEEVSKLAKQFKLWIVAGTMSLISTGSRVRSSCLVYDDNGICAARYDKIHLFNAQVSMQESYEESRFVEPGDACVLIDTPIGRMGLSVCYDLRFPELYRRLAQQGAEIFAVPSAFTAVTGAAHWEVLCRARAIENLCYVLAANQGGEHENGRETYGHSMIVDPWGGVIALQEKGEKVLVADIDLERLNQLRKQFPCNEHHVL